MRDTNSLIRASRISSKLKAESLKQELDLNGLLLKGILKPDVIVYHLV